MLKIRIAGVFIVSLLLVACGNKGDLFLKSETNVDTELEQLDKSIDELDQLEQDTGDAVPATGDTDKDEDDDDEENKKNSS